MVINVGAVTGPGGTQGGSFSPEEFSDFYAASFTGWSATSTQ